MPRNAWPVFAHQGLALPYCVRAACGVGQVQPPPDCMQGQGGPDSPLVCPLEVWNRELAKEGQRGFSANDPKWARTGLHTGSSFPLNSCRVPGTNCPPSPSLRRAESRWGQSPHGKAIRYSLGSRRPGHRRPWPELCSRRTASGCLCVHGSPGWDSCPSTSQPARSPPRGFCLGMPLSALCSSAQGLGSVTRAGQAAAEPAGGCVASWHRGQDRGAASGERAGAPSPPLMWPAISESFLTKSSASMGSVTVGSCYWREQIKGADIFLSVIYCGKNS